MIQPGAVVATLTGSDLAVVLVTLLSVASVVALVVVLQRAVHALRRTNALVAQVEEQVQPLLAELTGLVETASTDVARADLILGRLDSLSSAAEGASRTAAAAVASPFIKVLSVGSGTSAAARRLRDRKAVPVAPVADPVPAKRSRRSRKAAGRKGA